MPSFFSQTCYSRRRLSWEGVKMRGIQTNFLVISFLLLLLRESILETTTERRYLETTQYRSWKSSSVTKRHTVFSRRYSRLSSKGLLVSCAFYCGFHCWFSRSCTTTFPSPQDVLTISRWYSRCDRRFLFLRHEKNPCRVKLSIHSHLWHSSSLHENVSQTSPSITVRRPPSDQE